MHMNLLERANIPTWAINALINDDYTGLELDDIQTLNDWEYENAYHLQGVNYHVNTEHDAYVSAYPAFGLPTTCLTVQVYRMI